MEFQSLGRLLIVAGLAITAVGVFFLFKDKFPGLDKIGRLPGDFYYQRDNVKVYFPLATSILLSVVLSLLFWLFRGK